MWKRVLIASAIFASTITALFGGEVFAVEGGNIATLRSDGVGSQSVCIASMATYQGSLFTADINKEGFEAQIVFDDSTISGNNRCKSFKLPAGSYSLRLNAPMSFFSFDSVSSRQGDSVLFHAYQTNYKYLHSFGSTNMAIEGSDEEEPVDSFPKVFEIAGECTFNKSGKVAGESCVDTNETSYVGEDNINTGISLFSEENAGKDFEVYFELVSSNSSQNTQATIFNAKLENSSRYYPGFTFRVVNGNTSKVELTSRLGTNNSSERKTKEFNVDDITGKSIKIIRINGVIKYSIDGGEFVEFDDFSAFTNYFDQVAVFGSSLTSSNGVQRKFNGTLRNMYIRLGTYEEENNNGGGGNTPPVPETVTKGTTSALTTTRRTMATQSVNKKDEELATDAAVAELVEQIEEQIEAIEATTVEVEPEDE